MLFPQTFSCLWAYGYLLQFFPFGACAPQGFGAAAGQDVFLAL